MSRSVNKVTLIGTLGRDPEVRYMPNGNAVANINIATDESYNDRQTGQKVEQTEWHRISVFGKLAEICQQYLKKGSRVYFEGKLRTREWEKDGVKRYTTEIIANDMVMLDSRPSAGGDNPSFTPNNQQAAPAAHNNAGNYQQPAPQVNQGFQQNQNYQNAPQNTNPVNNQSAPVNTQGYQNQQPAPAPSNNFDNFDDDIPF